MSSDPITGVYNDAFIAEVFESYRRDPASVEASWRQYFRMAESLGGGGSAGVAPIEPVASMGTADPAFLRKVAGAAGLAQAVRQYGHLAVHLDPLGTPPAGASELTPAFHGIVEGDLAEVPAAALGEPGATAADAAARLREIYSSRLAIELGHLEEESEREWFRRVLEHDELRLAMTPEEKQATLVRLTEVDGLERFIARAWVNMKRFSIEGTDTMVPMLDAAIDESSKRGTQEVVIGMAHRGRVNVLAHILDKPYGTIFNEFDGKHAEHGSSETGDVKYHLGAITGKQFPDRAHGRGDARPQPEPPGDRQPGADGGGRARASRR